MRIRTQYTKQVVTPMPSVKNVPVDFSKIKIGAKTLSDATLNLGDLQKINPQLANKEEVLRAIYRGDIKRLREISNFFYRTSGIYSRLCRYMAYLYRYDWMVTPYINSESIKNEKVTDGFYKILKYLDDFEIKKFFGDAALKVVKNGCYYGYLIPSNGKIQVQELHPDYCRSNESRYGRPCVEFNMRYFDNFYRDPGYRQRVLNFFPKEFKQGYELFKKGKLPPNEMGDESGWYLLDPASTICFNLNGQNYPPFIAVIPTLIDLDVAQDLDRKKMQQQLLKIIIQKMPLDKNNEMIFDPDEAVVFHNNAVRMLGKAIGIDVLTTYADVEVADMSSSSNVTATDDSMDRALQAVFDQSGVSQMQFNTDGNVALQKSILNDEASMYNLLLQFESFLNYLIEPFNKSSKKLYYKVQILPTTIYNYTELAKLYKEQTQLGYSKMLPQIALGQSQSSILANAFFENDILDLINIFVPPLMSSTMNSDMLKNKNIKTDDKSAGRKELPDDQKTEKTIQNIESQN